MQYAETVSSAGSVGYVGSFNFNCFLEIVKEKRGERGGRGCMFCKV